MWRVYDVDCRRAGDEYASGCDKFDLFFCDPPYNQGVDYGKGRRADQKDDRVYLDWLRNIIGIGCGLLKPGGAAFVMLPDQWVAYGFQYLTDRGLEMRNWIKWNESFGEQTKMKFGRMSRHILYFVDRREPFRFYPDAVKVLSDRQAKYGDKRAKGGGKVVGDVWDFPRVCGTHAERVEGVPTQLPEALLRRVVRSCTKVGDDVLEFCTGSGSLGRVCVGLCRQYQGWESDPDTALLAARRIQEIGKRLSSEP